MVTPILLPSTAFDPATVRLSQNFHETLGVKKAVVTVPGRKPARQEFIRVHADPAFRLETAILNLKEQREIYLAALASEITPMVLVTVVNRQKMGSLWPIRLPGAHGRLDAWNTSALRAAEMAQAHWARVMANMSRGAYDVFEATGDIPEPEWPELSFEELLRIGFKGHFIDSLDHSVVQRLGGHA